MDVSFSLRDQEGRAVVVPAEQLRPGLKIYELGPGTDGWEEIDYSETSVFVNAAEDLKLEVVFVLDFTNSMVRTRTSDGRTGAQAVLESFKQAVNSLPGNNRIGVVEFHDRNVEPAVLSPLTSDKAAVINAVDDFEGSLFESGASRVWDGIATAVGVFTPVNVDPNVVRALVFMSDGRDTSSFLDRMGARAAAEREDIQLYAVGVGDVYQEDELRSMAEATGGGYYIAREIGALRDQFQVVVDDLRGQYRVSYITLRRTVTYATKVRFDLPWSQGELISPALNVAAFYGADTQGILTFDPTVVDTEAETVRYAVRAAWVPRNVTEIRFKPQTARPVAVSVVGVEEGGIIGDWQVTGPDDAGYFSVRGDRPIDLGATGLLFTIAVTEFTAVRADIPVTFDNSIYPSNKSFIAPAAALVGIRVPPSGRIAFQSDRAGRTDLFAMDFAGSDVVNLTQTDGVDETTGSWSPDGISLVFDSDQAIWRDVYIVCQDGTGRAKLTESASNSRLPSWSPDGTRIVFDSDGAGKRDIYVMDLATRTVNRLTNVPGDNWWPVYSPGGEKITFVSTRNGHADVFVMNSDGTGQVNLTPASAGDFRPVWSPDGSKIAFYSVRDGNREVYVMNADSSEQTNLTRHAADDWHPSWSPNGAFIAFTTIRDGNMEIYMMYSDGDLPVNLTSHPANDDAPVWGR